MNTARQTICEKIISKKAGKTVQPGQTVVVNVDLAMATDGSAPMAIDFFKKLGSKSVCRPDHIVFVQDHYVPCPNDKVAALHQQMKMFAREHHCLIFETGEGICHRLLPEKGLIKPGSLIVGADSHTTTYGSLNAFSTGIGSSDFAGVLYTGQIWMIVPATLKVMLYGTFSSGVFPKDLALHIVGVLGSSGANYLALEFGGEGVASLSMEGRFTICNMGVETGAKASIMPNDAVTEHWLKGRIRIEGATPYQTISPDPGASYVKTMDIDVSELTPKLAVPHRVDRVEPVRDWEGKPINMALIGTCTNGGIEDLRISAQMLKAENLSDGVQLLVVPPSRQVLLQAMEENLISTFVEKGAMLVTPGCGPCCGALNGVPQDGDVAISTANRNFKGRMGNVNSEVFLASPATVTASAITGKITDPRRFLS